VRAVERLASSSAASCSSPVKTMSSSRRGRPDAMSYTVHPTRSGMSYMREPGFGELGSEAPGECGFGGIDAAPNGLARIRVKDSLPRQMAASRPTVPLLGGSYMRKNATAYFAKVPV
jgi:hypothetical protein